MEESEGGEMCLEKIFSSHNMQGCCTAELTSALDASTRPAQDLCIYFVTEEGRAHETPSIPERLLIINGSWGKGYHFKQWCSH